MSDIKEYVITLKNPNDLDSFYNDLETVGGSSTVPDRAVPVYLRRPTSINTHYFLTDDEANLLKNDPRVKSIEIADIIRNSKKLNSQTGVFSKTVYTTPMDNSWKNWALLRCIEGIQRENWGDDGTPTQNATITIGPTGKNVDVIVVDGMSGVPNHPEFAVNDNGTGGTRYVQYNWFQLNAIVTSIDDDAATPLSTNYSYAPASVSGNANHGTHTAGTACGNTQGWARGANIYQIDPVSGTIDSLIIWDYIRAFHKNKPINPVTGRRNPTICNCSYGSTITFPGGPFGAVKEATYRTGGVSATGKSPYNSFTSAQLNSVGMYNYTSNGITYTAVPYYSPSEADDVTQAINDGIIIVGSAGNDSFCIDKIGGPDYENQFVAAYGSATAFYLWNQHRGSVPGSVPGVICVGAVDAGKIEKKGYYSNTGPRIDIFAPGTWIVSSFSNSSGGGWGNTITDSRNNSYYIGREIGTSMAAPQVTGVLACLLEIYQNMTPLEALKYIQYYSKLNQLTDSGGVGPTWTTDTTSLQGATNRYLYMPVEKPTSGPSYPKQNYNIRPTSGRMYPRVKRRLKG